MKLRPMGSRLQLNLLMKVEVRKVEGKGGVSLLLRQDKAGSFVLEYKTHAVYNRREMKNGIKEYDAMTKHHTSSKHRQRRVICASMPQDNFSHWDVLSTTP